MVLQSLIERFEIQAPITVMVRAALENALSAERLDALFKKHAQRQTNRELLFSAVADMIGLVAARIHPSPHAAFQARAEELGVTVKALYDKLQRMETGVSRYLVRGDGNRFGIAVSGGADCVVVNCTVANCPEIGISVAASPNAVVFNNCVVGSAVCLNLDGPAGKRVDYNLYFGMILGQMNEQIGKKA